ncbi:MAG TPA: YhjD/YihY/BrkB family envelope integrity protein [Methylomirabilota bacterium]|jgi:membrane protein|nr:YhjD/YihY/BrkB family envelope integrity protein [Methylomirabilota bacterium]
MAQRFSRFRKAWASTRSVWDESALRSQTELSKLQKFAHFWVLVGRSFSRNRCPVRASALAYASLLSLIPMLAVVVSVTSTFLKKEGEEQIDRFIVKFVASVIPPDVKAASTNDANPSVESIDASLFDPESLAPDESGMVGDDGDTKDAGLKGLAEDERAVKARRAIAHSIHQFIRNTRSGALGVTGSVLLIFAGISMLGRIEDTFNDIWGVVRGRSWLTRILLYWGVISLGPLLVIVAIGLASGPHLAGTKQLVTAMPFLGSLVFRFLPVVVLCLTFALFYMLMPNTKVQWRAALVGGVVAGLLLHLNNLISVLYVSRVVSNSKIYGSLGLVPVFMIGLYFSWLLLLFGAQVAYAYQNRATYLEEKQVENINQRGREFVALRLMTCIGQRFVAGEPPPGVGEIAEALAVPTRLIQQVMHTLCAARLVVEVAGAEPAYMPARPIETITCHDILQALRATQGKELATRDEPTRKEVAGEFLRIEEAERNAASSVTMLALVHRAQAQVPAAKTELRALEGRGTDGVGE